MANNYTELPKKCKKMISYVELQWKDGSLTTTLGQPDINGDIIIDINKNGTLIGFKIVYEFSMEDDEYGI